MVLRQSKSSNSKPTAELISPFTRTATLQSSSQLDCTVIHEDHLGALVNRVDLILSLKADQETRRS